MLTDYSIHGYNVHRFVMPVIASNMYMIIAQNQALIIDPHESEEAIQLLESAGINSAYVILTHEHYDHISGVNQLRSYFTSSGRCIVYGNNDCKAMVEDPTQNMSAYFMALMIDKTRKEQDLAKKVFKLDYRCSVDIGFKKQMNLNWQEITIKLIETPGHSKGSICILLNTDDGYLFSGDSFIKNQTVITKLPGGDRQEYRQITRPFFDSLGDHVLVLPGHGDVGWKYEFQ